MAKRSFDPAADETVIGQGLHVKGSLEAAGHVWIDGTVNGPVTAVGNVVVNRNGRINGPIKAANISSAGRIRGNLTAQERVILEPNCDLKGDIDCRSLNVNDGAVFNGAVKMPVAEAEGTPAET